MGRWATAGSHSLLYKEVPKGMNTVYHDFVVARHQIWEKRQLGLPAPWATDPLLNTRKFTNVFRVLDAGTQFVIRELFPDTTYQTALMRAFLYRYTNRPEPWELSVKSSVLIR